MRSKPYPRPTETREPRHTRKRLLDTNILIDALFANQERHAVVGAWLGRLLRSAPEGRILIPDVVHDEYMWVAQNKPVFGKDPASAKGAILPLEEVLRYPSVQVVKNANPAPRRIHRAILQTREPKQRKTSADLRIAFTAVQHGALLCTANTKDFGAISEALPSLKFYDPARFHKRLIDTNILVDALFANRDRHAVVAAWLGRLLRSAPEGRILIPDVVHDEYMRVAQNSPMFGEAPASAEDALLALKEVLRYPSVQAVKNANPAPRWIHRAILKTRGPKQRKTSIAFTAVQHGALLCTANTKDFGAISEELPSLKFYDPARFHKRLIDTNILIDALFTNRDRHAVVAAWLGRLLHSAPEGRILIPDVVHDEYMWVAQNSPVLGEAPASKEGAILALEGVLRYDSVQVVANARPAPRWIHRAILKTRGPQQRKISADLRIAFTAVQHGALLCTANTKDFGTISEALPSLEFYDPARFHKEKP